MTQPNPLEAEFEAHRAHLRAVAFRMLGSQTEAEDAAPGVVAAAQPRRARLDREPRRLADDRRRPRLSRHAPLAQGEARAAAGRACPSRWSRPRASSTPSTRRCSPTRSAWPSSWSWRRSSPPSGSRSSSTTCSASRSTRSRRSSIARPRPRVNSPAAPGGGCGARRPSPTSAWPPSARSSTRSSPPRARATSMPWSGSSTRTSSSAPTPAPASRCSQPRSRGPSGWPRRRCGSPQLAPYGTPVVVNGAAGVLVVRDGRPVSLGAFTVRGGRIAEIDILADPVRLRAIVAELG